MGLRYFWWAMKSGLMWTGGNLVPGQFSERKIPSSSYFRSLSASRSEDFQNICAQAAGEIRETTTRKQPVHAQIIHFGVGRTKPDFEIRNIEIHCKVDSFARK